MALHYPTDYYIFALVLIDHPASAPKDKGLVREVQNRIPHFVATPEADATLINLLKLEQEIGKEICWVASEFSLDAFIENRTGLPSYRSHSVFLPNSRRRFCTIEQKLKPIFWHCFLNYFDGSSPLIMNVGFRFDEAARVRGWTCDKDKFKLPESCSVKSRRQKYQSIELRVTQFPLYSDRVTQANVTDFWQSKNWVYPEISNCSHCFHHTDKELKRQAELEPAKLDWWLQQEAKTPYSFGSRKLTERIADPKNRAKSHSCACTD